MCSRRAKESDSTLVKIPASMNKNRTNRRKQVLRKAESKSIVPPAGKPGVEPAEPKEETQSGREQWLLNGAVPVIRRLDIDSPPRI